MRSDARLAAGFFALTVAFVTLSARTALATGACASTLGPPVQVLESGEDESGIGGTGRGAEDSGIGGTGRGPEDSGIGGTGRGPEDSGIGGTGRGPDDSGVGGTGFSPRSSAPLLSGDDDDSGSGGTGHGPDDSGSGGTGLFGPAHPIDPAEPGRRGGGGARVCVSGVEVVIPETLALEYSGGTDPASAAQSVLSGQIVFVEAVRMEDGLVARSVVLAEDGAGRIDHVQPDGTFVVAGRRLALARDVARDPALGAAGLEAGRWIRFQSQPMADGDRLVTRVAPGLPGARRAPDAAFERDVPVRLRDLGRTGRIDSVSIEGYLARRHATARIGSVPLSDLPTGHVLESVPSGARVRIAGRIEADGSVRPSPVRAPSRPDTSRRSGKTDPRVKPSSSPPRPERPSTHRPKVRDAQQPAVVRPPLRPDVRPKAPSADRITR